MRRDLGTTAPHELGSRSNSSRRRRPPRASVDTPTFRSLYLPPSNSPRRRLPSPSSVLYAASPVLCSYPYLHLPAHPALLFSVLCLYPFTSPLPPFPRFLSLPLILILPSPHTSSSPPAHCTPHISSLRPGTSLGPPHRNARDDSGFYTAPATGFPDIKELPSHGKHRPATSDARRLYLPRHGTTCALRAPLYPFPRSVRSRFLLLQSKYSRSILFRHTFLRKLSLSAPVSAARSPLPPPALPARSLLSLYHYLPTSRSPLSVSALYALSFPALALRELFASPRPSPACTLPPSPCPLVPPAPLSFFLSFLLLIFIFIFALLRHRRRSLGLGFGFFWYEEVGPPRRRRALSALPSPDTYRFQPSISSFVATTYDDIYRTLSSNFVNDKFRMLY
ncbi:hypothetical protein C8R44DRAFT_881812 [Mycena epipterygia]|nr:hypothetical protein C8R44DRAFT_881812 [Mycena epipterygia]